MNHLHQLTWLRGIAAIFVLFSHITQAYQNTYTGELNSSFFNLNLTALGNVGVALFFTLSGCTLYLSSYNTSFRTRLDWINFYLKRFFRVWPLFAISLLIYIIAGIVLYDKIIPYDDTWFATQFIKPYSIYDVLSYLSFTFNLTGPSSLFNNAFWSLPVEFQYYLILPILIVFIRKHGGLSVIGFIIASHIIYKLNFDFIHSNLVFRLFFTFSCGVYIGYLFKRVRINIPSFFTYFVTLALLVSLLFLNSEVISKYNLPSEWIIYGAFSICIVSLCIFTEFNIPSYVRDLLEFCGDISYSLYLFHNLIIAIGVLIFINYNSTLAPYKFIFLLLFSSSISIILSWLSYIYLEKYFINTGKKLAVKNNSAEKNRKIKKLC